MRIVFIRIKPRANALSFLFSSSILNGNFTHSSYPGWAKHGHYLANALRLMPVGNVVERICAYHCIEGGIGVRYF